METNNCGWWNSRARLIREEPVFRLAALPLMPSNLDGLILWNLSFYSRTNPTAAQWQSLSRHCIRSPDSNVYVHIWCLCLISCLSSQLSPEDYRERAYTHMPEEVDIDVSSAFCSHDVMFHSATQDGSRVRLFLSIDQTQQVVWAGQIGADTGGQTSAAVQREGDPTLHICLHFILKNSLKGLLSLVPSRTNKLKRIHSLCSVKW